MQPIILNITEDDKCVRADDMAVVSQIMSDFPLGFNSKARTGMNLLSPDNPDDRHQLFAAAADTSRRLGIADGAPDALRVAVLPAGETLLSDIAERLVNARVCLPWTGILWHAEEASYSEGPALIEGIRFDAPLALYRSDTDKCRSRLEHLVTMPAGTYLIAWAGDYVHTVAHGYCLDLPDPQDLKAKLSCTTATAACDGCNTRWTGTDGNSELTSQAACAPVFDLDNPRLSGHGETIRCARPDCLGVITLTFS